MKSFRSAFWQGDACQSKNFTLLLALAILMVVGAALLPKIDVADKPRPRQQKTLTVEYSWPRSSAKVIEQNVTSRIEGLVSSVKGVESVLSESYFGSGKVTVNLKKTANVSSVKFEISSLLKQIHKRLPEGVTYPVLTGGEIVNENERGETTQLLLTYQVNSKLSDEQLKEYMERNVERELKRVENVKRVEVTGGVGRYIEISYDPFLLANYGLTAYDLENGIRSFLGREDIVGEVVHQSANGRKKRVDLYLTTSQLDEPLEQMPLGLVDGKTVYLNDLVSYEYKNKEPKSYFRVNGLNTIYLNIYVDAEANKIALSNKLQKRMAEIETQLKKGVYLTLTYDGAQERVTEMRKLVWRSLMALAILLFFVWLAKREWKYLYIMVVTLAAIILTAVIAYKLLDIRLHIYTLAGITVSLGMVVDASIVMTDHYSYYHDRKVFLAITAALLTTIGSLVVVFWLPEFIQKDLYDFAWIIIINLSVALLVAYAFTPALIEQMKYRSNQQGHIRHKTLVIRWTHFYSRYISFTQRHKWVYIVLLILAFGGTMRLFAKSLSTKTYSSDKDKEMKLTIRAQMPLGGKAAELNEKVIILENFLSGFDEIKRFETRVESWGATIVVEFKEGYRYTSVPYLLEKKVIGKVISIGGADWSTSGISERGFSNSLNLQYRSNRIEIAGYNYDRLYRIAEDMCETMKKNSRIVDLTIEIPGHENQEDEFYMRYNKELMALYDFDLNAAHRTLKEILSEYDMGKLRVRVHDQGMRNIDDNMTVDMHLKSSAKNRFDLWYLQNAHLKVNGVDTKIADFMDIERRGAKNCIPKKNQEYVLRVAFNVLGSYTYANKYIEETTNEYKAKMPVGYHCLNASYGHYKDTGTQYWLIMLIVIIIYFICSILFESFRFPLVIISLIPVSFIGTFLVYYFSGVEFGTGGFASLVCQSGLTVNGGIYILNEYKQVMANSKNNSVNKALCMYVRAYNHKITAVLLTILSTALGLVPFLINGKEEEFWFSFAVGSIGGLLFSVLAVVFTMPILMSLAGRKL